jgi:hypothetical protein
MLIMVALMESIGVLDATIISECCVDIHKRQVVCCENVLTILHDFLERSPMKKDAAVGALRKIRWTKKG